MKQTAFPTIEGESWESTTDMQTFKILPPSCWMLSRDKLKHYHTKLQIENQLID